MANRLEVERRRDRLHQLLDLARAYRGWSRNELARALDRDPSRLYPDSDNPKLDFVALLADALEWPIDAVVEFIYTGLPRQDGKDGDGTVDIEKLREEAKAAYFAGEYHRVIELARKMFRASSNANDRARACSLESSGWDGLGRFQRAQQAIHRGLLQSPRDIELIQALQSNLANAHFTLWELESAIGVATSLIEWYYENPPKTPHTRVTQAFAYYVRGTSFRRKFSLNDPDMQRCARRAREDLAFASEQYKQLAAEFDRPDLAAIAHTCDGGVIETEVELGKRTADEAMRLITAGLEPATDVDQAPAGGWLESYGWWCVFGAKVALRHLEREELQHHLAIFVNKLLEIAERSDNWAFRERALSLDADLRRRMRETTGFTMPAAVDEDELRLLTGAMGRFPSFRATALETLRSAKIVKAAHRRTDS